MTELRDPLDDLLAEVPAYVVPDVAAAWRAGARRRTRRRAGVAVALVVAIGLVAGLAQVLPRARDVPPAGRSGSIGYPAHVDKPWFLHDLPDQPGRISALVQSGDDWLAAAPDGRVWRVPQDGLHDTYPPALSADGRMLAYLAGPSTYVLRDLSTGEEATFDDVTEQDDGQARTGAFGVGSGLAAYWSPDGTRLVVGGAKWIGGVHVHALLLGTDGSRVEVKDAPGRPVGWLDDDTIAWLHDATLSATDLAGRVEHTHQVHIGPVGADGWSTALSPDRTRLAVVLPDSTGTLVTVDAGSGAVLDRQRVGAPGFCPPAWAGDEPAFFQENELDTAAGLRTVVVDPAIRSTCILAAADALGGPRHERFGDRVFHDGWLSWHWQEVALGLLLALLLLAGAVALLSARSRRRSA